MAHNQSIAMSSPSNSSTSTPLYRVFRGLKTTQIIPVPSTNAAWRSTIHELKGIYLQGRWKECESKCLRLVNSCEVCMPRAFMCGVNNKTANRASNEHQAKPVIHGYLLFLIGSCVEMHARNMHQYSAAKTQKLEDAAMWLERCEVALSNAMLLEDQYEAMDVIFHTPLTSHQTHSYSMDDEFDATPMVQLSSSIRQTRNTISEATHRDENTGRVERVADSINKIIDADLKNPYHDETDPFLSISSTTTPQRDCLTKIQNWAVSLPRLTPSPLRIRKAYQPDQPLSISVLPSSLSNMSFVSSEVDVQVEEEPPTPRSEARIQARKEAWRAEIDRRVAHKMNSGDYIFGRTDYSHQMMDTTTRDEADQSFQRESLTPSSTTTEERAGLETRPIPRTLSEMIRDCLGQEGSVNMNSSCLRPIPHSSSAKPLPLCFKPKNEQARLADDDPNSDRASLARLEHAWGTLSFNGVWLASSDLVSLHAVQMTWPQLSEEYHLRRHTEQREYQTFQARVTRFNHHLSFLSRSLQQNIFSLRQLAADIDDNRTSHIHAQRLPPSKSYWSFSAPAKDIFNDKKSDDSYDEHRDKPEMRRNLGWAAPGTVLNETKEARIQRLKRESFQTVGLRNEKRGHKGDEWYSYLCEEAVGDIGGVFQQ